MGIGLGRGSRGGDTTENPPSMGMSFLGHNLPEHEKKPTPKKQTIIQLIHSLKVVRRYQYYGYHSTPDLFIECRYFNPNHSSRIRTTLMRGMSEHALHSSVPRPDQTRDQRTSTSAPSPITPAPRPSPVAPETEPAQTPRIRKLLHQRDETRHQKIFLWAIWLELIIFVQQICDRFHTLVGGVRHHALSCLNPVKCNIIRMP